MWRASVRGLTIGLLGLMALLSGLRATAAEPPVLQQSLQHTADGLFLTARVDLAPSAEVEDALLKGVALYFVWQAEVVRDRWYWSDKRVAQATRTWRLVYQPLTRRWRLSQASPGTAASGGANLQYALHQNFDNLEDALAGVSRVLRWKLADAAQLDSDERVSWRFRLDLGLLPRPFQIGMANQPAWDIDVQRTLRVPPLAEGAAQMPAREESDEPARR